MTQQKIPTWGIILLIVGAVFLLNSNFGLFTIFKEADFVLDSKYIVKGGLSQSFQEISEDIEVFNHFIGQVYGLAIFDGPIVIEDKSKDELVDIMDEINQGALEEGYPKIFSSKLINKINADSIFYVDLAIMETELEESVNTFCEVVESMVGTEELLIELCDQKPDEIFVRDGTKYILNLNDVTYTDYEYVPGELDENGNIPIERVEVQKTIRLSDLKLEISEKSGDIFVALGSKGISEVEPISGKYEFAQYAYEIDHEDSMSIYNWDGQRGYTVISNSNNVVDASGGEIEESGIMDLWYGLKRGEAYSDWKFIAIVMGGIIFLFVIFKK